MNFPGHAKNHRTRRGKEEKSLISSKGSREKKIGKNIIRMKNVNKEEKKE